MEKVCEFATNAAERGYGSIAVNRRAKLRESPPDEIAGPRQSRA
jgi:hypothetical protein